MTYIRKKKSIFVRSVWVMLALFFALLTIVFSVGLSIASDNAAPINKTLGAESSIRVQVGGGSGEVVDHYPSAFIERYADGSPIYQVDEYGNKTTIMDDEPMRAHSREVAGAGGGTGTGRAGRAPQKLGTVRTAGLRQMPKKAEPRKMAGVPKEAVPRKLAQTPRTAKPLRTTFRQMHPLPSKAIPSPRPPHSPGHRKPDICPNQKRTESERKFLW